MVGRRRSVDSMHHRLASQSCFFRRVDIGPVGTSDGGAHLWGLRSSTVLDGDVDEDEVDQDESDGDTRQYLDDGEVGLDIFLQDFDFVTLPV